MAASTCGSDACRTSIFPRCSLLFLQELRAYLNRLESGRRRFHAIRMIIGRVGAPAPRLRAEKKPRISPGLSRKSSVAIEFRSEIHTAHAAHAAVAAWRRRVFL